MFEHFVKPLGTADLGNPFLGFPEFDSMRPFCLKFFKLLTRVLITCSAKLYPFFCRTGNHAAQIFAIVTSLLRTTAFTLAVFYRPAEAFGNGFESARFFVGADK